jgi:hypothetical protein
MKLKISLLAIAATLLFASAASAHVLPFGLAKRAIAQTTASICADANECRSWSVQPCRRQSLHRVDCLANFFFPEGRKCSGVIIARVRSNSYDLILQHKRLIC